MPITLKHIGPVVGLALAVSATAFAQTSSQQPRSPGSPPSTQQPSSPPSSQAPGQQRTPGSAGTTARGEIVSVDSTGKMLTIKMADGTEQKVRYGDATKVTGERGGVAGLGKMSGRQVIVHFNGPNSTGVASEIEIQRASGASPSTTPSDRPGGAGDRPGGTGDRPGGTGDRPGGTGDRPGGAGGDHPGAPGAPEGGAPGGDQPSPQK